MPKFNIVMNVYNEEDVLKHAMDSLRNVPCDKILVCLSSDNKKTWEVLNNFDETSDTPIYIYPISKESNPDLYHEGVYDFGAARNYILTKSDQDWNMYHDADDIFVGGQNVPELIEQAEKNNFSAILLNYYFSFLGEIKKENCITVGTSRRIFRKSKFHWHGRMHEKLIGPIEYNFSDKAYTLHNHQSGDRAGKFTRNLDACIKEFADEPTHYTLYNLAQAYDDCGKTDEAIKMYKEVIDSKTYYGYPVYRILIRIAELYLQKQDYKTVLDYLEQARKIMPEDALWKFKSALVACLFGKYDIAIEMLAEGFNMKMPESSLFYFNPLDYTYNPAINLQKALELSGKKKESLAIVLDTLRHYPEDKYLLAKKEELCSLVI